MHGVPRTPDGRYIVVNGSAGPRLWRASNPHLAEDERIAWVERLMNGRREVALAKGDPAKVVKARTQIDAAKRALGERGPVWWSDGAPDLNRTLVKNSPYAAWWDARDSASA